MILAAAVFAVLSEGAFAQSNRLDIVTPFAPELASFATAYFGLYLKGEEDKRAYLDASWKGFKRGTTVGLILEHSSAVR